MKPHQQIMFRIMIAMFVAFIAGTLFGNGAARNTDACKIGRTITGILGELNR